MAVGQSKPRSPLSSGGHNSLAVNPRASVLFGGQMQWRGPVDCEYGGVDTDGRCIGQRRIIQGKVGIYSVGGSQMLLALVLGSFLTAFPSFNGCVLGKLGSPRGTLNRWK